jgi:hypothetical protein
MKTLWRLLKKLNIDLPYDPAIPLLGHTPRNATQVIPKAPAPHVYCSTICLVTRDLTTHAGVVAFEVAFSSRAAERMGLLSSYHIAARVSQESVI